MHAAVAAVSLTGLAAHPVTVEASTGQGLPGLRLIGLPDTAVREAAERIRAAFHRLQLPWPPSKIVVNLAPAALRKAGGGFDVAVVARGPQRGAPVSGARVRVGVGAFGEDLDDLAAPAPGGGEQRGLTRDCSRGRRLGVDEDERPFDRGGVRGAGGDVQQRASSSVALVEVPHGLPQGCDAVGVAGTGGQRGSTATTGRGRMRPDLAFPRAFLASAVGRRGGARWILSRRWASRVGRTESINHGAPERSRRHLRSRVSTSPGRAPDVCGARQ